MRNVLFVILVAMLLASRGGCATLPDYNNEDFDRFEREERERRWEREKPEPPRPHEMRKKIIAYEIVDEPVRFALVTYEENGKRITTTMDYHEFLKLRG